MGAPIDPRVDIGHVHLKVADLDRALAFYRDVLGFEVTQRYGEQAAFLSAGGYHHHLGLNTWESRDGSPPPPGTSAKRSTSAIRTATESSSTATGPSRSGRVTSTVGSRWSARRSTST